MLLYQPDNISKKDRVKQGRIIVAAFHYLHTSQDGMVIANLAGFSPRQLHKISESEEWLRAIRFWASGKKRLETLKVNVFMT